VLIFKYCILKLVEVVAAIIVNESKILCMQRGESKLPYISKKYEFPGGKIEIGETNQEALIREIKEELNLEIRDLNHFLTIEHTYPDFKIVMHSYKCVVDQPTFHLSEHLDFKWRTANQMDDLDWAAADLPIVDKLKKETNE
jgi:8-oxo-dGTP diphosphatase